MLHIMSEGEIKKYRSYKTAYNIETGYTVDLIKFHPNFEPWFEISTLEIDNIRRTGSVLLVKLSNFK